jgi:hypothetical protein
MEDILAIIFLFGGAAVVGLAYSPIGRAFADRARHGKGVLPAAEPDPAIYAELDQLRADVTELQERLDFAERLLAAPGPHEEKPS